MRYINPYKISNTVETVGYAGLSFVGMTLFKSELESNLFQELYFLDGICVYAVLQTLICLVDEISYFWNYCKNNSPGCSPSIFCNIFIIISALILEGMATFISVVSTLRGGSLSSEALSIVFPLFNIFCGTLGLLSAWFTAKHFIYSEDPVSPEWIRRSDLSDGFKNLFKTLGWGASLLFINYHTPYASSMALFSFIVTAALSGKKTSTMWTWSNRENQEVTRRLERDRPDYCCAATIPLLLC